jgi:hypothetical protein
MAGDEVASNGDGAEVLDRWSARKVQPIVILYLLGVFAAFIVASLFIFHSPEAVKALLIAAVGAVAATVPSVLSWVEYRATTSGIEKRTVDKHKPRDFEEVFRWDELSRVVPVKHGFKYSKKMIETKPLRRFWRLHISDRYAGEIQVEGQDLERVLGLVERQGIAIS